MLGVYLLPGVVITVVVSISFGVVQVFLHCSIVSLFPLPCFSKGAGLVCWRPFLKPLTYLLAKLYLNHSFALLLFSYFRTTPFPFVIPAQ